MGSRKHDYSISNEIKLKLKETSLLKTFQLTNKSQILIMGQGTYLFKCYGAEGGNNNVYLGGKGSYIAGAIYIDKDSKSFTIDVGGKGSDTPNKGKANPGGYPDGGASGNSNKAIYMLGSAGGGGSSSVYLNNDKILVAAGGSGSAGNCQGAPGGNLEYSYEYEYVGVNSYKLKTVIPPSNSQCETDPLNTYQNYPPSGIGGGYPCGKRGSSQSIQSSSSYLVSSSGMSYINRDYMKLVEISDGNSNSGRTGNGEIIVNKYCSDENCYNCLDDPNKCSICKDGYHSNSNGVCKIDCNKFKQNGVCVENCDPGYFISSNNECIKCHESCSKCDGIEANKCTECTGDRFLENNMCISSCGEGKYGNRTTNTCDQCSPRCKICNSFFECTKCTNGYYLSQGNCNHLASQQYEIYRFSNFNKRVFKNRCD